MSRSDGYWERNPEAVAQAKDLWDQGLPASQIALRFNTSKNAILGLKSRRGWTQRGSPIKLGVARPDVGVRQHQRRIQAVRVGTVSLAPLASATIAVAKKKPDPPKPAEAPRAILRPWRQCAWLDGANKPFERCKNEAFPGYPYCAQCCRRCYINWHGAATEAAA